MHRREFIRGTAAASAFAVGPGTSTARAQQVSSQVGPLVWPVVTKLQPGIRSFAGHTNTVPDVIGRIGVPPSLVIFTEGNHLMALLSDDIIGAFPAWAKSQAQFAELDFGNIMVVTLPQPIVVQMIMTGALSLGNLTLEVSRKAGFYPDIVMAGPDPLKELRKAGVIEAEARFFAKNRGFALMVPKGNPMGIKGLSDVVRTKARIALPDAAQEAGSRARYRVAVDAFIGKSDGEALFAAEVPHFPGRLGIVHRDFPEMVARGYADVAITQYHLISYWTRLFPDRFELIPIPGAERFFIKIAMARVVDPLRSKAMQAFEQFFLQRTKEVYPKFDLARMTDEEHGEVLKLDS